jgi:hypothetical protein
VAEILGPHGQPHDARPHRLECALRDVAPRDLDLERIVIDEIGRLECLEARDPDEIPGTRGHERQIRLAALDETRDADLEAGIHPLPGTEGRCHGDVAPRPVGDLTDELLDRGLARHTPIVRHRQPQRDGRIGRGDGRCGRRLRSGGRMGRIASRRHISGAPDEERRDRDEQQTARASHLPASMATTRRADGKRLPCGPHGGDHGTYSRRLPWWPRSEVLEP